MRGWVVLNELLERYLYVDDDAYYVSNYDGKKYAQSVHGKSFVRYKRAREQEKMDTVPIEKIIGIIKDFLGNIGIKTIENPLIENPLEINYQEIKEKFKLNDQKDIVWLKFTTDGHIGVVAASDDVNFDFPNSMDEYDKKHKVFNPYTKKYEDEWVYNTSGILLHKLYKTWDKSFILLFPLNGIPYGYNRSHIEHAIGNLLIENKVPILDYFSHLYYNP